MDNSIKILLVDDDRLLIKYLGDLLKENNYYFETARDGVEAISIFNKNSFDMVITDLVMPKMGGLGVLASIKESAPQTAVIILTGNETVDAAVQAMKQGAYDYITKPVDPDKLLARIDKFAKISLFSDKNRPVENERRKPTRFENIIGNTPIMFKLFEDIQDVARSDASVLIMGENGTGKELVADAIYYGSGKKGTPFIKLNCGAFAETVVESELFGHEKGSFTGALSRQKGIFESVDGGTLFLDETGELSASVQVKLLRVLETGDFQRVGGREILHTEFRLISATNKNLAEAVMNKEFREDLFYRINTVTITLPPLRERKADIPLLADYFIKRYGNSINKKISGISGTAIGLLMKYDWPGNVRELAHVIERSIIYCKGREIVTENLPANIRSMTGKKNVTINVPSRSLSDVESTHIYNVLEETNWNLQKTAKILNIARGTLYSKMEKHGIEKLSD